MGLWFFLPVQERLKETWCYFVCLLDLWKNKPLETQKLFLDNGLLLPVYTTCPWYISDPFDYKFNFYFFDKWPLHGLTEQPFDDDVRDVYTKAHALLNNTALEEH